MHAVIEITGPDEIHIIDLGSTRGTLVNGERISKTRLQSGDEIMFGDSRVQVTFLSAADAQMTPPPAARAQKTSMGLGGPAGQVGYAPPPPTAFAPPPAQQYAAPAGFAPPAAGGYGAGAGAGAEV
jgi:predicted component of type VI protein secretion system